MSVYLLYRRWKVYLVRLERLVVFLMVFFSVIPLWSQVQAPYIKYTYGNLDTLDNGAQFCHCKYYSSVFQHEVGYLIYLPKHYFISPDSVFPVMYLYHGSGGNYVNEYRRAMYWHKAMNEELPEMVMVMTNLVDENYHMVNFEATMIDELRQHIVDTYRVSDQADCSAVSGYSLGGQAAMLIALKHSDLFSQVVCLLGAPFLDLKQQIEKYKTDGSGKLNIRITVGTLDNALESSHYLKAMLTEADIPFSYKEYEGIKHSPTQSLNDSIYRREMIIWQKETFAKTCPVPWRSSPSPSLEFFDLPFVDEYHPVDATPLPPKDFKFRQISDKELEFTWQKSEKPVNGYVLQRIINTAYGIQFIDSISSEAASYIETRNITCDSNYFYQLYTWNEIGRSAATVFGLHINKNCLSTGDVFFSEPLLTFYPNPVNKQLIITLKNELDDASNTIVLHDLSGKPVLQQRINSQQIVMDVRGIDSGIYILSVIKEGHLYASFRILIE